MTRRRRRGFTLTELVVVLTLSSIVGAMLIAALISSSDALQRTVARADAQRGARELLDVAVLALRGARPLARCGDVADTLLATPTPPCVRAVETGPVLEAASASSLVFYAYSDVDDGQSRHVPDAAPDRIVVAVEGDGGGHVLTLTRQRPRAGTTYTDADATACTGAVGAGRGGCGTWRAADRSATVTGLVDDAVFAYLDDQGNCVADGAGDAAVCDPPTRPLDADERERVALVRLAPRFAWTEFRGRRQVTWAPQEWVALTGSRYRSDGGWAG